MATTTTLSGIIKTWYMNDEVLNQINAESVLFDKLKVNSPLDVSGKNYTYAIRKAPNVNAGRGISEGGDYGSVGSQGTDNITVPNAEIVTPIELTTRALNAAKAAGKGAFASAVDTEVRWGMKDTVRALNRQLHSDGTDALAFWTAADDTSGTNVDDGQGNNFPLHIPAVQTLDLVDASDNATLLGTAIVVTPGAENGVTSQAITWTGTVSGSADGDYLVMTGTLGKQIMGIRGVISADNPPLLSGGLHSLPVATNAYWKSQVLSNSGTLRALTLELMQKPLTQIGLKSSSGSSAVKFLMGNGFVKNKYIALLVAQSYFVNSTTLKGGQEAVDFNGRPLIEDNQCRRNTIYYVSPSDLAFLSATNGIGWADYDGNQWVKKIGSSGYAAAYQAFIKMEGNLACKSRNSQGALLDLIDV